MKEASFVSYALYVDTKSGGYFLAGYRNPKFRTDYQKCLCFIVGDEVHCVEIPDGNAMLWANDREAIRAGGNFVVDVGSFDSKVIRSAFFEHVRSLAG